MIDLLSFVYYTTNICGKQRYVKFEDCQNEVIYTIASNPAAKPIKRYYIVINYCRPLGGAEQQGFVCIFATQKLRFRCRPAGIDQAATGSLDLIFESRCKAKIIPTRMGGDCFVFREYFRCYFYTILQRIISPYPHPYWVRLWGHGFSHGLKKCPPDTFLPSLRSSRPFESLLLRQ